jgi:hypothetical protein
MSWYWFSFSYKAENQGCCNVEADTPKEGLQKTIDLNIHPKHDSIECYEIPLPELKPDTLISKEELMKEGFRNIKS